MFMVSFAAVVLTAFGLTRAGRSKVPWSQAFASPVAATRVAPASAATGPNPPIAQTVPRSFVAAAVLVFVAAVADAATPPPALTYPTRASFEDFPTQIGDWVGQRKALQGIYLDALHLDDYVLTNFSENGTAPINFYSAYYQSQDNTRAIHSPHDCIPGGGWQIVKFEQRTLPATRTTQSFQVNRAIVQLGDHRQIVYYWFDERGREVHQRVRGALVPVVGRAHPPSYRRRLVRFVAAVPPGAGRVAGRRAYREARHPHRTDVESLRTELTPGGSYRDNRRNTRSGMERMINMIGHQNPGR